MVYFVAAIADPDCLVKIGFTSGPFKKRFDALQSTSPVRLGLLVAIEGDQALEARLHARFAADRRHGEWFFPSLALRNFIAELLGVSLVKSFQRVENSRELLLKCARILQWSPATVQAELKRMT